MNGNQYEVLSPWADVDPVPLRGISPRLPDLDGKRIGLFRNFKQAAKPLADVIEIKLRERFPGSKVIRFDTDGANVIETETDNKERFLKWVDGIDAAITLVGN